MNITPAIKKQERQDGSVNIKIRVAHNNETRFISTNYNVFPTEFNPKIGEVKPKHPKAFFYNTELKKLCLTYQEKLAKIDFENMSINAIIAFLLNKVEPLDFKAYFETAIKDKRKLNQPRSAELYEYTLKLITEFHPGKLMFEGVTYGWLTHFEDYVKKRKRGNSQNAVAIPLRNIRAVFNYAIKNHVIPRTVYPFEDFEIKKTAPVKRSLTLKQIRYIRDYKTTWPVEALAQMAFMLSFYLIGINNEDVYNLTEIKNGRIDYTRAKTGKEYSIKVEPEAAALIESLKGEKRLLKFADLYVNTHAFTASMNRGLKRILPGIDIDMYSARHSWATIASNKCNANDDRIAASLGHTRKTVTDGYITRKPKKVDKLNRKVLDRLLMVKEVKVEKVKVEKVKVEKVKNGKG
jgi:integrase